MLSMWTTCSSFKLVSHRKNSSKFSKIHLFKFLFHFLLFFPKKIVLPKFAFFLIFILSIFFQIHFSPLFFTFHFIILFLFIPHFFIHYSYFICLSIFFYIIIYFFFTHYFYFIFLIHYFYTIDCF